MANVSQRFLDWYDSVDESKRKAAISKYPPDQQLAIQNAYKARGNAPGIGESLVRGSLEGGSAGHGAEIEGAANTIGMSPMEKALGLVAPVAAIPAVGYRVGQKIYNQLTTPNAQPLAEQYRSNRDSADERNAQAEETNPIAFKGAEGASALATGAVIPGGPVASALGYGAALGSGKSKADLTKGEVGDYVTDVGTSAAGAGALGAGMTLAAKPVAALAGNLGTKISNSAAWRAFQAAHPDLKDLKLISKQGAIAIGRRLLGEKLVKFGNSSENIADNIAPALANAGAEKRAATAALDKAHPEGIGLANMADTIEEKMTPKYSVPGKTGQLPAVKRELGEIRDYGGANPNAGFTEAETIKSNYQELGKPDNATPGPQAAAMRDLGHNVKTSIEDAADPGIAGGAEGPMRPEKANFLAAKQRYHELAPAHEIASEASIREARARGISLSDYLVAIGAMSGHGTAAIPAAITNHLLRTRGSASAAVTMDAISKALRNGQGIEKAASVLGSRLSNTNGFRDSSKEAARILQEQPDRLGKYAGPLLKALMQGHGEFAKTHDTLLATDPAYQRALQEQPQ